MTSHYLVLKLCKWKSNHAVDMCVYVCVVYVCSCYWWLNLGFTHNIQMFQKWANNVNAFKNENNLNFLFKSYFFMFQIKNVLACFLKIIIVGLEKEATSQCLISIAVFTLRARLYYKRCMHQLNKEGFCRENLLSVGSFTLISKMGLNEREINKQYKKETSISKCFFLKQNNEVNLWAINLSSPKIQLSLAPAIFYLYQFCLYKKKVL